MSRCASACRRSFLLGIVLAGVVAALISLRLFQTYTRSQSYEELQREASGPLAALRRRRAARGRRGNAGAIDFAAPGARARDRRPDLLRRRARSSRARTPGSSGCPSRRCRRRCWRADGPCHVRVHAARAATLVPRRRRAGAARAGRARRSGRSSSRSRARSLRDQWLPLVLRLAAAIAIGGAARRAARLVALAHDHQARAGARRAPRTRSRPGTTPSASRSAAAATRSATSPSGSTRWPRGSRRPRSASASS